MSLTGVKSRVVYLDSVLNLRLPTGPGCKTGRTAYVLQGKPHAILIALRRITMRYRVDNAPLQQLEEWDEFVATRHRQSKSEEEFRNYQAAANLP
jgi:hypothetical protein